jgi:uncharacterized membrane protein (UPF0127 family)
LKTKKNSSGWFRIIGAILVILVLTYLANVYIIKNKTKHIADKIEKPEPQFVKEGSLAFLSVEGDTIRTIDIEIADEPRSRQQGLMYRRSMPDSRGMLFVFDRETKQSFWMKDTKMSLDILYVSADKEIVTIYKHTQPYSTTAIPSFKPALYVVELAAGFCDRFGVKEGDHIAFKRN